MNLLCEYVAELLSLPGGDLGYKELIPPPPPERDRIKELELVSRQYNDRHNPDAIQDLLDKNMAEMYDALLVASGKGSHISYVERLKQEVKPMILFYKNMFGALRPYELASKHGIPFQADRLETAQTPSYPSGHTTQAFYIAEKLSRIFPDLEASLFSIANMVAESRIDRGVHLPSDNAAGKMLAAALSEIK